MRVELALFGEKQNAHALISSSGDPELAKRITGRTDLPDQVPLGVVVEPCVCGFVESNVYVLSRIEPDHDAPRAGMVKTKALMMPLDEIIRASDLRPLITRLNGQFEPAGLEAFEWEPTSAAPFDKIETARVFDELLENRAPVIDLVSPDHMTALALAMWSRLTPALRRQFQFRLSFGPQDITEALRPALVYSPPSLKPRWIDYPAAESPFPGKVGLAAAMIAGDETGAAFGEFLRELDFEPSDFAALKSAETLYELAQDTGDFDPTPIRLAGHLVPDCKVGRVAKRKLLSSLISGLRNARPQDLAVLRNLELSAFEDRSLFWSEVADALPSADVRTAQDDAWAQVIRDSLDPESALPEWRAAIIGGIRALDLTANPSWGLMLWRIFQRDQGVAIGLLTSLRSSSKLDRGLAETAPAKINMPAPDDLMEFLAGESWFELHAALAKLWMPLTEAATRQLAIEHKSDRGLNRLLVNISPIDQVQLAATVGDGRLVARAGRLVANDPALIADLEVSSHHVQTVWAQAMSLNAKAWQGPRNPDVARRKVLDAIVAGTPLASGLIEQLASTPLADLSAVDDRRLIWPHLHEPVLGQLLDATADGWLERLFTSSAPPSRPEPELEGRLLNPDRLDKFLTKCAQESPGRSASLVMAVPGLSEARYIAWFTELLRKPHIVAGDADAIGRAVACRSWRGAAHVLLEAHRSRKDLKPALQACRDLYGLWDIWLSDISRPSESERSRLFFDVACDLFPKGPTQGHVWERAGGKPKDLDLRGTGADRWHFALGEAARGKLPKSALMREMRHDFPSNQQLAYLARFREFGGSDW